MRISVKGPTYFSQTDEDAFFGWLRSIKCVRKVTGHLRELHIELKRRPTDSQLRELRALFLRYRMNMRSLYELEG